LVISADSKVHFRPKAGLQPFRGIIGIALWVHDTAKFTTTMNGILERFFADNRIELAKKAYSASEIAGLLPGPPWKLRGLLRKLARALIAIPETHINAYFLTLDLNELRERKVSGDGASEAKIQALKAQGTDAEIVQIYGEPGREAMEYVSVSKFFEIVGQYFPVICAHKLCNYLDISNEDILLDGCTGPRSKAWDALVESNNTVNILPNGDNYNSYICVADILTRWIDEELRQGGLPLNQNVMIRVLKEWKGVTSDLNTDHVSIVHIGNKDLGDIKPLAKDTIERYQWAFARHPILYVFLEEADKKERARVENSPLMDLIHNRVFDKDGSLAWWTPELHARMITKGDAAVVYGDRGLEEAVRLQTLRYPIEIWDLRKEPIQKTV
jgi:hypothetical protein